MLPRKRQRLNRAGPCSQPTTALSRESATSRAPEAPQPQLQPPPPLLRSHRSIAALSTTSGNEKRPVRPATSGDEKQIRKAKSWYGASPRTPTKAAASTSVARENILGGTLRPSRPPDLGRFEPKRADDAASLLSAHTAPPRPSVPQRAMTTDDGRPPPLDGPAKDAAGATHAGAPSARPRRMASSGWLGWWASAAPAPGGGQPESTTAPPRTEEPRLAVPAVSGPPASDSASTASAPPAQAPTSWFGFWLSSTDASRVPEPAAEDAPSQGGDAPDAEMTDAPAPPGPAPKVGSMWAFWSRAPPKTGKDAAAAPEAGEIAVMGEGSEARPQPVAEGDVSGPRSGADQAATDAKAKQSRKTAWRTRKRARPAAAAEPTQPANLLLPCFTSTYVLKEDASVLRQVANLLLRISSTPPPSSSQPAAAGKHVLRVRQPPRIRRAVAIGVHGLMPAPYLRPMIGQPTGTSLRFATLAAEAIGRWAAAHGCADCAVDNLWKLMLNWIDQLRRADLIVVASHSQGVPVSVMLLDKLVDLGLVAGGARIGVCAMAGVALGPFADYRSSILMGSAAELWEFGDPHSAVSRRFEAALARILDHGARVTFIGSIDDQLVPMESAVYSPAGHPYIYRAVFIDGRVHAPDFIVHLVGFALKLRNLGISDHGLIRELSAPLAGSLYSGEGHSRLYYDAAVYDLAVAQALETSTVPRPAAAASPVRPPHPVASAASSADGGAVGAAASPPNPYVLPWIMCGVLEEDFVKTELGAETDELLRQFDAWRPATKALRDVKYRLEAVRSRL